VNDSSIYITANFKETQLDKIRPGQKVEIEVDAYPELKLEGSVFNFSPATGAKFSLLPPDNATGNFVKVVQRVPVKIKINGKKEDMDRLRPGMSVNVSVIYKD
jgi:membrane fusion protein (multidrug efflux system)